MYVYVYMQEEKQKTTAKEEEVPSATNNIYKYIFFNSYSLNHNIKKYRSRKTATSTVQSRRLKQTKKYLH